MKGKIQPQAQGFMIPLNELDFQTVLFGLSPDLYPRQICNPKFEAVVGAPWYACENIRLTGTVDAVTARVGDTVTIQVGIQALPTEESYEQLILSVQAWVCYPNTVTGGADASLVVPSMQNNQFASYDFSTTGKPLKEAPAVYNNMNYHRGKGFLRQPLSPWTPTAEDFMDEGEHGGHCCIIANSSGLFDFTGTTGTPVGQQIFKNSELQTDIDVCTELVPRTT